MLFGTSACAKEDTGTGTSTGAPATSKAADPKATLLSSLSTYEKGIYALDYTGIDGTGQGKVDTSKKHVWVKMVSTDPEAAFSLEMLVLEPDAYMKLDMGDLSKLPGMTLLNGKKWIHVDRSKAKDAAEMQIKGDDADFVGLKALLGSAQSVQAAGDKKFTGTLDLTKGTNSPIVDEDVVKALADKASTVPFTATLDAENRLSELLVDVPAAGEKKAHQLKLKITEYGAVTMPAKPTGSTVVEAPDSIYQMLNNA